MIIFRSISHHCRCTSSYFGKFVEIRNFNTKCVFFSIFLVKNCILYRVCFYLTSRFRSSSGLGYVVYGRPLRVGLPGQRDRWEPPHRVITLNFKRLIFARCSFGGARRPFDKSVTLLNFKGHLAERIAGLRENPDHQGNKILRVQKFAQTAEFSTSFGPPFVVKRRRANNLS